MIQNQNRHNDHEWMNIIHKCRNSGLTDKEWCSEHNIPMSTFYSNLKRLYQGCVTEHMGRNIHAGFLSESTEEVVYILILHCRAFMISADLKQHMVCFNIRIMIRADILRKEIHQFIRAVQYSGAFHGLDLCQVLQFPSVTDVDLLPGDIEILKPKCQCLTYPHPCLERGH